MTMKYRTCNPYLPSYEYIPDGEPHVFDGRLYIFGSHDRFNGEKFCMNDYVTWSCPVDDLSDWRYEGVIYKKTQDPENKSGKYAMWAPDVCAGKDGRYYLYYCLANYPKVAVAVADFPAGPYEFYGYVRAKDGRAWGDRKEGYYPFDPAVLVDDDGSVHLYAGQGPLDMADAVNCMQRGTRDTVYHVTLDDDMLTMQFEPDPLIPDVKRSKGTGFEGHEFFEASSIRKFNGKYYFIYSSVLSHELAYAVSDRPDSGFEFKGTLVSNGDVTDGYANVRFVMQEPATFRLKNYTANTHGSIVCVNGEYYVFYHRHTNWHGYSRQGCAEKITLYRDGTFSRAFMTSSGIGGPWDAKGTFKAYTACLLQSRYGAMTILNTKKDHIPHPGFTQEGPDREDSPNQYIANLTDGARCGFKWFDFGKSGEKSAACITVTIRGNVRGVIMVRNLEERGDVVSIIPVDHRDVREWGSFSAAFVPQTGIKALYFQYFGTGSLDFDEFSLK